MRYLESVNDSHEIPKPHRRRELDFLRGIAIILVLFRHIPFNTYTANMGWIGVDLFFVLSGFLVSGLLFKEYISHGNIEPLRFLIRRGFKIYPIYYMAIGVYAIFTIIQGNFYWPGLVSELLFVQNYVTGLGWSFPPGWSLAVEEHFYFGLVAVIIFLTGKKMIRRVADHAEDRRVESILIGVMVCCLILRIASSILWPTSKNFVMTHLRIDSLLAGVLIAYLYYFRHSYLIGLFDKYRSVWLVISFLLLGFTPFIEDPASSFFARTFGLSLVYLSFGMLLIYFLSVQEINKKLNGLFSRVAVNAISKIGVWSYSIYIVHWLVIETLNKIEMDQYVRFAIAYLVSIVLGAYVSLTIESFFLRLRDRYFPTQWR